MPHHRRVARVSPVESISSVLGEIPRLDRANCKGRADVWDEEDPTSWRVRQAMAGCRTCPALRDCSDWLASLPRSQRPPGVVAGRLNRRPERTPRPDRPKRRPRRELGDQGPKTAGSTA
ncbi:MULTISPECIES: hypothetical protein [Mycobacterium]|uniref:4Fe-4S Wbl-type domain-containing protein n=1 Tax=Mycobacterium kiyosense TaxID=2871094 RepID=A0A9P3Q8G3_9MYCO|nr:MULTISPECIES: hypothetical protein [Mycobacterium]BDB43852.1 hypothetical protein IWGMT90018_42980 [Mycobacterium kiyosense]BDE15409.1 hypothetical protein MKCMC460_42690 [Mycobacterium sp. 20KCMC460]GLB82703.1 hypothetical protein SRL2020028_19590 [Mycobacterium kiyosense]GLB90166.1 hypothetical protein SRL2020130_29830 [Mycobacterium kiyosense]GLB95755.1 hypothetical protein SRL2020226_25310 [Mycobacterium kiyosense]